MIRLKPVDRSMISELIRNSKLSDREIAKKLGVSQPTVSRRRAALDKEGLLDYTAVPDLKKLGFEILAFTFGRWNLGKYPDTHIGNMKEFIKKHPSMIFASTGTGLSSDRMGISIHKSYSDYAKTIQEFKTEFGQYYESVFSFIVSLQEGDIIRNLTFKSLTELLKQEETQE